MYKIEDVASLTGLTKRTLRYYEEIGLLTPERSEGGFRLYADVHVEQLKKIINARDALGFSLLELQEYVAIGEEIALLREGIGLTEDVKSKRVMIKDMEKTIGRQLEMIDLKLARIQRIRSEFKERMDKIQAAKIKYGME